jgi:hypothetical protein
VPHISRRTSEMWSTRPFDAGIEPKSTVRFQSIAAFKNPLTYPHIGS